MSTSGPSGTRKQLIFTYTAVVGFPSRTCIFLPMEVHLTFVPARTPPSGVDSQLVVSCLDCGRPCIYNVSFILCFSFCGSFLFSCERHQWILLHSKASDTHCALKQGRAGYTRMAEWLADDMIFTDTPKQKVNRQYVEDLRTQSTIIDSAR